MKKDQAPKSSSKKDEADNRKMKTAAKNSIETGDEDIGKMKIGKAHSTKNEGKVKIYEKKKL